MWIKCCGWLFFCMSLVLNSIFTNAHPIFEDDSISPDLEARETVKEVFKRSMKTIRVTTDIRYPWPSKYIPYDIDCSVENLYYVMANIKQAIATLESKTCLRFIKRRPEDKSYILFRRLDGCHSHVGYKKKRVNNISLGKYCESKWVVLHEIGHSIGFLHPYTVNVPNDTVIEPSEVLGAGGMLDVKKTNKVYCSGTSFDDEELILQKPLFDDGTFKTKTTEKRTTQREDISFPTKQYRGRMCRNKYSYWCVRYAEQGKCEGFDPYDRAINEVCGLACNATHFCDMEPIKPMGDCTSPLGIGWPATLPNSNFFTTSSSSTAHYGRLYSLKNAWCAPGNAEDDYLQVDFGQVRTINAVATQGRGFSYEHVQTYSLSFSDDNTSWREYQENGIRKIFDGNCDYITPVLNILEQPVSARYIRFHPITYLGGKKCMRVEVYGC